MSQRKTIMRGAGEPILSAMGAGVAKEPVQNNRSVCTSEFLEGISATSVPVRRLMGIQVVATGSYVPDCVVTNEQLATLGCDAEWILQRTGIR
jgi:hypothetical protein